MKREKIVYNYYLIAELVCEDDDVCSKEDWLNQLLLDKEAKDCDNCHYFQNRDKNHFLSWAKSVFDGATDYYSCIVQEKSQKDFPLKKYEGVYFSPNIKDRVNLHTGKKSIDQLITYYFKQIEDLIKIDRRKKMLENRRRR